MKLGLVLEGGGMRGAYTAGALSWLIDQNIEFDYGVGISAGAINLTSYLMKDKDYLRDISVHYMSDKKNVGLTPFLKEQRYVGYDYMFDDLLLNKVQYRLDRLRQSPVVAEIGLYNLETGQIEWVKKEELDDDLRLLKAACTLPIAGRIVDYQGKRYLDGGIKTMIPIDRSVDFGCDKHLVIITKCEGYVRKEPSKFAKFMMKFNYPKYLTIQNDYAKRTGIYYSEMDKVQQLEKKDQAILIRPSKNLPVKRFSGDPETLKQLYALGYQDMERQKERIMKFVQK